MSGGTITFPTGSIASSAISGLSSISLSAANTWSALQTFSSGISITGGIGVPSTTMTAPTSTQIGYQSKITGTGSGLGSGSFTFGTITLSPVGSVWLINANVVLYTSGQSLTLMTFDIQLGSTWSNGSPSAPGISTLGKTCLYTVPTYTYASTSICGSYTVTTGNQTLCFGAYLSGTTNVNPTSYLTATRIA